LVYLFAGSCHGFLDSLRSMDTTPNNLPLQLSSFVGREQEIAELKRLLTAARLVTLTGPGGSGKTRLALQVAASLLNSFIDGVWFVELAPLFDPALVPVSVATVLGMREEPGRPLLTTMLDWLRSKQLLLILDNCEHLIDACAQLAEALLQSCAQLHVLATSREALRVPGETTWLVPTLTSPNPDHLPPVETLWQFEAVRLFLDRARAIRPTFELTSQNASAIASICYRLDGIPLALELAATQTSAASVEQIARRLDDRFRLFTSGHRTALPRHRTLRAAIQWSYDLLSEPEPILFRRLSVFAGGWAVDAAEAVCADGAEVNVLDLLTRLVNKSLVLVEERESDTRYRMLETIRQYAQEKLAQSGEEPQIRARHLGFFMRLAEEAELQLHGPDQVRWFNRLETEYDNLRVATDWSLSSSAATAGLRLTMALRYFRFTRGYHSEGLDLLAHFLTRPEAMERTRLRARALQFLARNPRGEYAKKCLLAEEALAIARDLGDAEIVFNALDCLTGLANSHRDFVAARAFLEQMLPIARDSGNKLQIRVTLMLQGDLAQLEGDYEQAQSFYEESLALMRDLNDKSQLCYELRHLGQVALHQALYEKAIARYQESLDLNLEVDDTRAVLACLAGFAAVAAAQAQAVRSARLLGAVEALLAAIPTDFLYLDQAEYERSVAAVRAQLDPATFTQAWAEGRAMRLEHAIAEAKCIGPELTRISQPVPVAEHTYPASLTEREVEVLRWLALGLSNAEIAEQLVLSPRTVGAHLRSIFDKLDVTTRTAAARVAADLKLV
jgi:predicted ATPase/DNA-binding NarL/FixJ family response regulator